MINDIINIQKLNPQLKIIVYYTPDMGLQKPY